jgi:hypothetical protein
MEIPSEKFLSGKNEVSFPMDLILIEMAKKDKSILTYDQTQSLFDPVTIG